MEDLLIARVLGKKPPGIEKKKNQKAFYGLTAVVQSGERSIMPRRSPSRENVNVMGSAALGRPRVGNEEPDLTLLSLQIYSTAARVQEA